MTPKETAKTIVRILSDKKALELKNLEVTELTILADYFIIATATSATHLKTLSDACEYEMKQKETPPLHIEGYASGSWILLDFGSVIVHLFLAETRSFYSLERLWADAKEVSCDD